MRRRQVLALSGSLLAGAAGCLSASAPEASQTDESHTTTGSQTTDADSTTDREDTTTTEYADVSVTLDALQPGLVTMTTPDSIGVSGRDARYLLVRVSTDGDGQRPAPESFSLAVGGADYRPESVDQPWRIWRFHDEDDPGYDRASGEGLLLFEFPDDPGSDADSSAGPVLTWPGGEWRPDESIRRRLARPEPPLSVSAEVPDSVEFGESPTVSVTVENRGDVPGRFVAGLNRTGPMVAYTPVERVSMLVPAGESETWEYTDNSIMAGDYSEDQRGDGKTDMSYVLNWADGSARRDVRYVE